MAYQVIQAETFVKRLYESGPKSVPRTMRAAAEAARAPNCRCRRSGPAPGAGVNTSAVLSLDVRAPAPVLLGGRTRFEEIPSPPHRCPVRICCHS